MWVYLGRHLLFMERFVVLRFVQFYAAFRLLQELNLVFFELWVKCDYLLTTSI